MNYLPLQGPFPRSPPDGLPVVLGQFPPDPLWLDSGRFPFSIFNVVITCSLFLIALYWVATKIIKCHDVVG